MVGLLCKSIVSFFQAAIFFVLMYSVGKVMSVAMHKWVSGCKIGLNPLIVYCCGGGFLIKICD
jgi:hypothetical protein